LIKINNRTETLEYGSPKEPELSNATRQLYQQGNRIIMKLLVTAIFTVGLISGTALADGDVTKGEQAFKKCMACHTANDKTNKVGPYLFGVVGRKVATAEGFTYSDSMQAYAASGAVWDEKSLDAYLAAPKTVVEKTKMAFAGVKDEKERADIIAYLKSKM
jgi:cytochrome c